jgi:hypothetical protein
MVGPHRGCHSPDESSQNRPERLEEGKEFSVPVVWDGFNNVNKGDGQHLPGESLHSVVMSNGGGRKKRGLLRAAGVIVSGGLLALLAVTYFSGANRAGNTGISAAANRPSELLWSRYHLDEEEVDPEDVQSMREAREEIARQDSTSEATRVGAGFKDNVNVGVILGRLTQVAFDTVVELKRAIRGLKGRDADLEVSSKVSGQTDKQKVPPQALLHHVPGTHPMYAVVWFL